MVGYKRSPPLRFTVPLFLTEFLPVFPPAFRGPGLGPILGSEVGAALFPVPPPPQPMCPLSVTLAPRRFTPSSAHVGFFYSTLSFSFAPAFPDTPVAFPLRSQLMPAGTLVLAPSAFCPRPVRTHVGHSVIEFLPPTSRENSPGPFCTSERFFIGGIGFSRRCKAGEER